MSKHKNHNWQLPELLEKYANERGVEFKRFSPFHMRISYGDTCTVDIWTSNKYWVKESNYLHGITERGGEKGELPKDIYDFLDKLLFAVEIAEED